jgi:hypothetical protein
VSHVFGAIGSYTVRATATDALGDTSTGSGSVNVTALGSVSVGQPSPPTPSVGQAVTFPLTYSTSSNSPVQRLSVDFGDGTGAVTYNGTPSSVSHTYTFGGTFAMRVTAFDAFGNTSTGGTSVVVGARPQPAVSITSNTQNPTAGTDVTFTASVTPAAGSGANIQDVVVDFGDNTRQDLGPVSGTNISIHHVFQNGGTFNVVLTATDTNGGVGTATTTIFVQVAPPLGVTLSYTKTIVDASNTLATFTATVTGLGNEVVLIYRWNFGDGTPEQTTTTNQVTHNYAHPSTPPTLVATVTITTSNNRTTSGSTQITP